jgi:hypothetical protein
MYQIYLFIYCSLGQGRQKDNSKNKNQIFEETFFSKKSFLHGEKENFEDYFLNLEHVELSFSILK